MLFEIFIEENDVEICPEALLNLIQESTRQKLNVAVREESTNKLIQLYQEFQGKVRNGHLRKTAKFWVSFMDNAKLVFMLTYAVKTNNRKLFHKCNGEMANMFFAFDGQNYSRLVLCLAGAACY